MAIQAKDILCPVSFSTAMQRWLLKWQTVPPSESRNAPVTVIFPTCHTSQASGHQFLALWKQCPPADGAMSSSFYDKVCRKHDLGLREALPVTLSPKFSLYQQSGTPHLFCLVEPLLILSYLWKWGVCVCLCVVLNLTPKYLCTSPKTHRGKQCQSAKGLLKLWWHVA